MHPGRFLTYALEAGERIRELARGDLTAPVPSCPDYDLRRLVVHCGYFCRFVTTALEQHSRPELDSTAHRDVEPLDWFAGGFDHLLATLVATDANAPTWTWGADHRSMFWFRRAAQELSVHRWDAESALGGPSPLDPVLAADGIDELFDEFAPERQLAAAFAGDGESLHLHATDVEPDAEVPSEWTVTARPDHFDVERAHAKGDVAAKGPASDLLLFLWGRVAPGELEVFGDAALLERWQERVRI